jgi:pimeloyl-ACP methyl ester carboxylesterase
VTPGFESVAGRRIAVLARPGAGPAVVWLGGFRSDMTATKASRLDDWAARAGRAFLRFDYSGHGASEGDFAELTLSDWLADALAVIERRASRPVVLVGSSMGGYIALLAARALPPGRLAGLVLIAPAPDFTERLIWAGMPEAIRREVMERGVWRRASAYSDEPTPITRALIEDGRRHLILGGPVATGCPVHILHGTADPDVPWDLSVELMGKLAGERVTLTLVKDGDHRLSTPADLELLERVVGGIA